MKLKTGLIIFFLLIPGLGMAEEETFCRNHSEELRTGALTGFYRIDQNFRNAHWFYRKAHETLYGPLWEAQHKRKESFQGNVRRVEAETLYSRYRILADQILEQAESELDLALQAAHKAKTGLPYENLCGAAHSPAESQSAVSLFNNCTEVWNHETGNLIQTLFHALTDYQKKVTAFTRTVESHLEDTGSDHSGFTEAYQQGFLEFDSRNQSEFHAAMQKITDRFQYSFPGEKCCGVCKQDKRLHWDPVLTQVKLDPQGDLGVTGNVVNNGRLLPAFKKMEEQAAEEEKNRED